MRQEGVVLVVLGCGRWSCGEKLGCSRGREGEVVTVVMWWVWFGNGVLLWVQRDVTAPVVVVRTV